MKKELEMGIRKKISKKIAERYQRARKKEKGKILDEFVSLMGYNRNYASWLLRNIGRKVVIKGKRGRVILIGEQQKIKREGRKKVYGKEVEKALKEVWYILDCPCGRRLGDYIGEIVPILEEKGEIKITEEVREKLLKISGRTIDRLLKEEKKKWEIRGKKRTKPGSLLKSQIPIRTFAEWDEKVHGFIEIDLVSHDGGKEKGVFAQTLDTTDVFTGWTETICVENKSQEKAFKGLNKLMKQFPFPILGIDSDNGGEFINAHLKRYCEEKKLTFTRSRPYRKNDNCFVEQKNWTAVRKIVGYWRYETEREMEIMNKIYQVLRLYTNFFQPQMKLINKTRIGSKVTKKYDKAKTPYQRVIECKEISEKIKGKLKNQYKTLNPAELKRQIVKLQNVLYKLTINNPFYVKMEIEKGEKNKRCVGVDF